MTETESKSESNPKSSESQGQPPIINKVMALAGNIDHLYPDQISSHMKIEWNNISLQMM